MKSGVAAKVLNFVLLAGMAVFLLLLLAGTIDLGFGIDALGAFTLGPLLLLQLVGAIAMVFRKSSATSWWMAFGIWALVHLSIVLILIQAGNDPPMWG